MPHQSLLGQRVPDVQVAELIDGQIVPVSAMDVLGRVRTLAIGVPGAFTPVCTERHVPGLVANAEKLHRSGYDKLVCIVASDPFSTEAWAKMMDAKRWIRFISDGNLNLARALGLLTQEQELFMGARSKRYMLATRAGLIESVRVEKQVADYACTRPDAFVLESV